MVLGLMQNIELNIRYKNFETYEDIDEKSKILIIEFNCLENFDSKLAYEKNKDLVIVVVDNDYNSKNEKLAYELLIPYYLVLDDHEKLSLFLKTVEKKIFNESEIILLNSINRVIINDEEISLSEKEFKIYNYLYERRNQECSRVDMIEDIFGYPRDAETRIIDVYVKYLREKLKIEGKKIETIRGVGYIYIK